MKRRSRKMTDEIKKNISAGLKMYWNTISYENEGGILYYKTGLTTESVLQGAKGNIEMDIKTSDELN
jgi:hypothetical protein